MSGFKKVGLIFDLDNTLIETTVCSNHADKMVTDWLCKMEPLVRNPEEVVVTFCRLLSASPYDKSPNAKTHDTFKWRVKIWKEALHETQDENFKSSYKNMDTLTENLMNKWNSGRLENLVIAAEVIEMLRVLKESGYKLAILTNGPSDIQQEKIDRCKAEDYFDVVVISGDVGVEKPDPEVFQFCLNKLGVSCDQAVMIGDNLSDDIRGAQLAEFRAAVWINPSTIPVNSIYKPDYEISNMLQFVDVLKKIENDST